MSLSICDITAFYHFLIFILVLVHVFMFSCFSFLSVASSVPLSVGACPSASVIRFSVSRVQHTPAIFLLSGFTEHWKSR